MEKENYVSRFKKTAAGLLAGINMMIPSGGLASSKETTSEDLKPSTSVSDVVIKENKSEELEKLEEMEVNQRFSDFLNGEGEYSDEKLKERLFDSQNGVSDLGYSKMGFSDFFIFQSVLLFHKNIDGEEILALGLKDRSGKRVVTAVTWPVSNILELGLGVHSANVSKDYNDSTANSYFDEGEISLFLDEKMGLLINLTMNTTPDKPDPRFPSEEFGKAYLAFFADKGEINRNFLTGIWRPKVKDMLGERTREVFEKYNGKGSLLNLNNYTNFLNLTNDGVDLPYVTTLYYQ